MKEDKNEDMDEDAEEYNNDDKASLPSYFCLVDVGPKLPCNLVTR